MKSKKADVVLHYPPRPPWGSWLSIDVIYAYLSAHEQWGGAPDRQKALERIVTSELAKPMIARLSKTLDYLGWLLLFDYVIDAVFMPFDAMHAALPHATRMQREIIDKARELAALIDEYSITCTNGKIDNFDADIPRALLQQLEFVAKRLTKVEHKRIGVGVAAWASRQQAGDGLAQFVRYLDDRIDSHAQSGSSTGGLKHLSANSMAHLAIAALGIKVSADDTLGKVEARVIQFRKRKGDNSPPN